MARLTLNLATLGDLDGGTAERLIDHEIARAVADLEDRAEEDQKVRKVVIQLELGLKEGIITAHVAAEAKLPPRRTKATAAGLEYKGGKPNLYFQGMNPERVDQDTFEPFDGKESV